MSRRGAVNMSLAGLATWPAGILASLWLWDWRWLVTGFIVAVCAVFWSLAILTTLEDEDARPVLVAIDQ